MNEKVEVEGGRDVDMVVVTKESLRYHQQIVRIAASGTLHRRIGYESREAGWPCNTLKGVGGNADLPNRNLETRCDDRLEVQVVQTRRIRA